MIVCYRVVADEDLSEDEDELMDDGEVLVHWYGFILLFVCLLTHQKVHVDFALFCLSFVIRLLSEMFLFTQFFSIFEIKARRS